MQSKRILILYNSIGLGHKSIAENIGYYLEQAGYEIKLADVLQVQGNWLSDAGAWLYHLFLTKLPFVWSWLYMNNWFTNLLIGLRTIVGGKNYQNVRLMVEGFDPQVIISTHTVSSSIVAFLKQKKLFTGKFGIAFSDFHLHRYWLYKEADFYLANIHEQKNDMVSLGVKPEKVFVCGMILPPKPEVNLAEIRVRLNIQPEEKVVLVSSGSQGTGVNEQSLEELSKFQNTKVLVICGKNEQLLKQLQSDFSNTNIVSLGYYKPMDELYAIADIYITKPGGLSTAEALRWNLPMLISHMLPGQEELNFDYLQDKGLVMPEPLNVASEAQEELQTAAFRQVLEKNAAKEELFPKPGVLLTALASVINSK